ncbi:MAG: leucine-rich repeat protein [Rikenellaceae bacterium]|nr:leucine-rich repeat protein [Rikenellaceae bacterium]
MKKFSLIAMLMALFTFAIACTPEVPEGTEPPIEMTISVTPAQLVFTAEGGTQNVTVDASQTPWSAECDADWCDFVIPETVQTQETIGFTVASNTGEERTTTVTFTLGDKSATLSILQLAADANPWDTIASLYEVPAEGAELRFGMNDTEDILFDYDPEHEWFHIDVGTTEDMSFTGISIWVFANDEPTTRECVVTLTQGNNYKEVTIRQAGAEAYLEATPDSVAVDFKAQQITLYAGGNVEYEITYSEGCDWITYNTSNYLGTHFDVAENPSSEPRQAQIIFSNATAGVSAAVTVNQEGRPERPTSPPNNQIWYSTWGYGETPYLKSNSFDREIVSNVYYWDEKLGIITFDGDVTEVMAEGWAYDDRCTWIMLPPSVTKIGEKGFYRCSRLEKFIAPGLTEMGVQAFAETSKLTDFDFSGPIQGIPEKCFYKSGFVDLTIPGHITDIAGREAFSECTSLQNLVFEEGFERISGYRAFYKSSTTSVKFPSTMKSTGEEIFYNNSKLTSLEWGGLEEVGRNCFVAGAFTELSIPSTVKVVGDFGFAQCDFQKLTIAADSIGDYAFYRCTELTEINIEPTTTKYGVGLFMDCTALESFRFPDHWKTTNKQLFENCSKLKHVDFNKVEIVDEESFQWCTGLTSIHFPSSVRTLMPIAFQGCNNLESITFDEGIETVYGSFSSCIIPTITLPASVKWIGDSWYTNHDNMTLIFKGDCPSLVSTYEPAYPIFSVNYGGDSNPLVRVPMEYYENYLANQETVLGYCRLSTY